MVGRLLRLGLGVHDPQTASPGRGRDQVGEEKRAGVELVAVLGQDHHDVTQGHQDQKRRQNQLDDSEPVDQPLVVQGPATSALTVPPANEVVIRPRHGEKQDGAQGEDGLGKAGRDAFVGVGCMYAVCVGIKATERSRRVVMMLGGGWGWWVVAEQFITYPLPD